MRKKHSLRALGIGLAVAAVAVTPLLAPRSAEAQNSIYYNWDKLGELDEQYAFTKIYRTADTKITPKKYDATRTAPATDESDGPEYLVNKNNSQVVILLENTTATDKNGKSVDVIFRLNKWRKWSEKASSATQEAYINFRKTICGSDAELNSSNIASECNDNKKELGVGDPIMFWVQAHYSDVNFSVEYIEKGSYDETTTKGTPAPGIDRLVYASFDYDIKNTGEYADRYTSELFRGDEGLSMNPATTPADQQTTFYYQKDNKLSTMNLKEGNNGLAINTNNIGGKFNGIYYANSAIATVTGLENSSYTFRYSAKNAGITVFFGSPINYDTPAPKKYIVESNKTICDKSDCSKNTAKVGDKFNYVITQEIPDQYSSEVDVLTFMSLWHKYPNIPRDHFYNSFIISDTIDAGLTPDDASKVKIYNKANKDITDMFTVSINHGTVTAIAKEAALTDKSFYANTFRIVVPVTVNDKVSAGTVKNYAKATFKQTGDEEPTSKDSNEVFTSIYHTITVNHISTATGKKLADTVSTTYSHGAKYETSALSDLPAGYKINNKKLPENASGIVTKDDTVTYYYDLYYTVTTKHVSKQNGAEIADPTVAEYAYKDEYTTKAASKLPEGYILAEVPKNAAGVVDDDIVVIYLYDIPPAPKTLDSDPAPFAFLFAGIGSFIAGSIFFLTRRR